MPALQVFLWEQPPVHCTALYKGNGRITGAGGQKQEGYCFPCMKKILGKDGMEWSA